MGQKITLAGAFDTGQQLIIGEKTTLINSLQHYAYHMLHLAKDIAN